MPNEFRTPAQIAGRVDYVKAGKPVFDLAAEAKKERAKMGGSVPPSQPPPSAKASQKPAGKQMKPATAEINKSAAPHSTKAMKMEYAKDTDEEY